jgi:hypothetical protein
MRILLIFSLVLSLASVATTIQLGNRLDKTEIALMNTQQLLLVAANNQAIMAKNDKHFFLTQEKIDVFILKYIYSQITQGDVRHLPGMVNTK